MKTDARVRYTKRALKDSLLRLMSDKPVKEITVKEVCDGAELNRATFYKHYQNCYDLLEQIENELIEEYVASLKYIDSYDVTDLIAAIFDLIDSNIELCRLLIFNNTDGAIIKKLIALTHESTIANWRARLTKASDEELELLFTCLANGFMHVVVEEYERCDREKLIGFVNKTVQSCFKAYM